MAIRLLSFLNDIENTLRAALADAGGPRLQVSRIVNYEKGLARIDVGATAAAPSGHIQLQHFGLADDRVCMKAALDWEGAEARRAVDIFDRPDINWGAEANRIAEAWLDGAPQVVAEPLAVSA